MEKSYLNEGFHTFRNYQLQKREQEQNSSRMTASMEDYLEMIYRHCLKEGFVRTNQLAGQLNVQASSVTKIVQKLAALGLLDYQKYSVIQLTDQGRALGCYLLSRHLIVENFLRMIGVDSNCLLRDTEMIEHQLSSDTVRKIQQLYHFLKDNPAVLKQFKEYQVRQNQEKPGHNYKVRLKKHAAKTGDDKGQAGDS
ncbi:MAG: DtxR family transcriptional regulator [Firmicutes bacterium]|nr:DtxR family transcriptional regulator [Bacillota bacterium]